VPQLGHIDFGQVAVSFAQARKQTPYGLYASLTPMRFEGGSLVCHRGRRRYAAQRLFDHHGREMLYILTFYLPRFMDQTFHDKLSTILHELWHIGPNFDGDLRRHPGRCYAHSHSQKKYDAQMDQLARHYLSLAPPKHLYEFLEYSFTDLRARYGRIYGTRIRQPKLLPLS
jgi:hypothetical protein